MATDHDVILLADEHRLNEAPFAHASRQRLQLGVRNPPRIRRVGPQVINVDVLDLHRRLGCDRHCCPSLLRNSCSSGSSSSTTAAAWTRVLLDGLIPNSLSIARI